MLEAAMHFDDRSVGHFVFNSPPHATRATITHMKRHHAMLLVLFLLAFFGLIFFGPCAQAAVQATGYRSEIGISGQVITNPVASTSLSVPNNAEHAWITVKGNPVCWANSGADATAVGGGEWPAGFAIKIDNDRAQLLAFRVINCAEGATTVKVWYTRTRRVGE
jgi:hypothetical protein